MTLHVPRLPLALDPLIPEVKRRMRRRLVVVAAILFVGVVAIVGGVLALESGGPVAVCVQAPNAWKERTVTDLGPGVPPTVVLTNFRFGSMSNNYGLGASPLRWPAGGVMIALSDDTGLVQSAVERAQFRSRALRVSRAEFVGQEGMSWPAAHLLVRFHGRLIDASIEARSVTPALHGLQQAPTRAMVAAVNRILAGVRTCSA
jgi:hypothetical protein